MSGEFDVVDTEDWDRIENLMKSAVEPINLRLGQLPCLDHTENIIRIKAQHEAEKEQKKNSRDSRDWLLKIILAVVAVGGFLQGIGFWRSLVSK
jgi:hypothetical protein